MIVSILHFNAFYKLEHSLWTQWNKNIINLFTIFGSQYNLVIINTFIFENFIKRKEVMQTTPNLSLCVWCV